MSPGTYRAGILQSFTLGQAGAISGTTNTAARSTGTSQFISSDTQFAAPAGLLGGDLVQVDVDARAAS